MSHFTAPAESRLRAVRLPRWLAVPADAATGLSDVHVAAGRVSAITRLDADTRVPVLHDAGGGLALPGMIDLHTHLDKTLTRHRIRAQVPGLLGAIDAMMRDRTGWTEADIHARASQGLAWAWAAGTTRLRTHCDWWEAERMPLAWPVLQALVEEWRGRIHLDCVNLAPLSLYAERDAAMALARTVAQYAPNACLGGFIHSSNWNPLALRHLVESAADFDLPLDLHIDEELNSAACGLATLAELLREIGFTRRVVCGHACALAAQDDAQALRTLDAVATTSIALVSLPATNLLLQDARHGVTPRQRGLTRVQEARARGIPVLLASDNVEDPFCASGSYDPLDALAAGTLAAQLDQAFDAWSDSICRADWIDGGAAPLSVGAPADLVLLPAASVTGFPSRHHPRHVMRAGVLLPPATVAPVAQVAARAVAAPLAAAFHP